MPTFFRKRLFGNVNNSCYFEPVTIFNCQWVDCLRVIRSVFGTELFLAEDKLKVIGGVSSFNYSYDCVTLMNKCFCNTYAALFFGTNNGKLNVISVIVGLFSHIPLIPPKVNIFASGKVSSKLTGCDLKKASRTPPLTQKYISVKHLVKRSDG